MLDLSVMAMAAIERFGRRVISPDPMQISGNGQCRKIESFKEARLIDALLRAMTLPQVLPDPAGRGRKPPGPANVCEGL